ncbi:MAG: RnfABCDGE type electron transport complex subunit D [Desulfobacteraceae bacterium]
MKRPELHVSMSPFVHSGNSVQKIMRDNFLALVPVLFAGWFYYGWGALETVLICAVAAVATELIWQKLMGQKIRITDGSALVTGVLLGLVLSSLVPWWLAVAGSVVAIIVGKQLLGGLGSHPFNSVMVGWAFVQVSYAQTMKDFPIPHPKFGLEVGKYLADPALIAMKEDLEMFNWVPRMDLFIGNVPGEIGTGCVLAILLGGIYLILKKHITWHIPVSFIVSTWILAFIFWKVNPEVYVHPTYHILSGWIMLGAFFLAPEMGTAPLSAPGMIIYGIGCGLLTMIIRIWGGYMEGVPFAILLMNGLTPILDRIRPRAVGRRVEIA